MISLQLRNTALTSLTPGKISTRGLPDDTPPLSAAADGDFGADELSLSRDLVRLTRLLRPDTLAAGPAEGESEEADVAQDDKQRAEITQTVRRVVDKLLHAPTVRVKQLAGEPGGAGYADALRELFDLDPQAVAAVSRADTRPPTRVAQNRIEAGNE